MSGDIGPLSESKGGLPEGLTALDEDAEGAGEVNVHGGVFDREVVDGGDFPAAIE